MGDEVPLQSADVGGSGTGKRTGKASMYDVRDQDRERGSEERSRAYLGKRAAEHGTE